MTDGFKFDTSLLCRASFPAELEDNGGRCIVEVTVYRLNAVAVHTFLLDGPGPTSRRPGSRRPRPASPSASGWSRARRTRLTPTPTTAA